MFKLAQLKSETT